MRIDRIETFTTEFVGFVRITTETGATGIGQVSTYNSDITSTVLHRQVAPWVLGVEFDDIDELTDKVIEREHKFPGSYMKRALGGLDTAIWDCRGKQAGLPVVSLLGGTPGPLRAYASSMRRDITPSAEAERFRRLRGRVRVRCLQVSRSSRIWTRRRRVAGQDRGDRSGDPQGPGGRRCAAGGRQQRLFARPGNRSRDTCSKENGIEHFEEPCLYWELDQTKQVADALDIAVTGGEQDCEIATWRRMIDMRAVDIVQPDILYLGGISRTLQVCRMAKRRGPADHAPQRQSRPGDALHDAFAAGDRRGRKIPRIFDRRRRLLSLARRAFREIALRCDGRASDGFRRTRLGHRDRP